MVELIWDGKYKDGKKVATVRIALPFQTIETVNESAQERQRTLDFFSAGRDPEWRNRLIWGDKKYVLPSLLDEFAGRVNLIYIDPPFATGADFSFTATVPDDPDSEGDQSATFVKEPSILEQKAYRDTWGRGLDSFLQWFYETAVLLRELLTEDGSIYVHLDYNAGHYVKAILDEIFGADKFRDEIIWKRTSARSDSKTYNHIHDAIFFYSKTEKFTWNQLYTAYDDEYLKRFRNVDPDGKKWQDDNLTAKGLSGGGYDYEYKGVRSLWRMPKTTMEHLDKEGRLHFTKNGGIRLKRYIRPLS